MLASMQPSLHVEGSHSVGDAGKGAQLLFSSIFPKPSDYFFFAFPEKTYEQVLLLANGVVLKLVMNVARTTQTVLSLSLSPFNLPIKQIFFTLVQLGG